MSQLAKVLYIVLTNLRREISSIWNSISNNWTRLMSTYYHTLNRQSPRIVCNTRSVPNIMLYYVILCYTKSLRINITILVLIYAPILSIIFKFMSTVFLYHTFKVLCRHKKQLSTSHLVVSLYLIFELKLSVCSGSFNIRLFLKTFRSSFC